MQGEQFEENRRCDVVGKIAGDAERVRSLRSQPVRRVEEVTLDDRQFETGVCGIRL